MALKRPAKGRATLLELDAAAQSADVSRGSPLARTATRSRAVVIQLQNVRQFEVRSGRQPLTIPRCDRDERCSPAMTS
jgi:hypothetical protein